jgi:hypothetical protein
VVIPGAVKTDWNCFGFREGSEMKKVIIALSAATLFVATPVFAHSASSKAPHHEVRAKHRTTHSAYGYATRTTQATGPKSGYYYAPTYAPARDIAYIATNCGVRGGDGGY